MGPTVGTVKHQEHVELDDKSPSKDKTKEADPKRKIESSDLCEPQKAKKDWAEKNCSLCKKHGGTYTTYTTKGYRGYNKMKATRRKLGCPHPASLQMVKIG